VVWCSPAVFYDLPFVMSFTFENCNILFTQLLIISYDLEFLSDQLLRLQRGHAQAYAPKDTTVCPSEVLTLCGAKG